jgi:hypothetical protein
MSRRRSAAGLQPVLSIAARRFRPETMEQRSMAFRSARAALIRTILPVSLAAACGLFAQALPAQATSLKTYVSSTGKDAGTCDITKPCKTFTFALKATTAGGTITVLSAGIYDAIQIYDKSVSIVANGVDAVIVSSVGCPSSGGHAAICIQTDRTAVVVTIQGLTIDKRLSRGDGIGLTGGASLQVRNSTIRGAANYGISVITGNLSVSDSIIAGNKSGGIAVWPYSGTTANVVVERTRIEDHSSFGIYFGAGISGYIPVSFITATVRDSFFSGNGTAVDVLGLFPGTAQVVIDGTSMVGNASTGVVTIGGGAIAWIGNCTISGSDVGINPATGAIYTFGNNQFANNGSDGTATGVIPVE